MDYTQSQDIGWVGVKIAEKKAHPLTNTPTSEKQPSMKKELNLLKKDIVQQKI